MQYSAPKLVKRVRLSTEIIKKSILIYVINIISTSRYSRLTTKVYSTSETSCVLNILYIRDSQNFWTTKIFVLCEIL
jgi:hypothetical protein